MHMHCRVTHAHTTLRQRVAPHCVLGEEATTPWSRLPSLDQDLSVPPSARAPPPDRVGSGTEG